MGFIRHTWPGLDESNQVEMVGPHIVLAIHVPEVYLLGEEHHAAGDEGVADVETVVVDPVHPDDPSLLR